MNEGAMRSKFVEPALQSVRSTQVSHLLMPCFVLLWQLSHG